jgi:hypothetical protein
MIKLAPFYQNDFTNLAHSDETVNNTEVILEICDGSAAYANTGAGEQVAKAKDGITKLANIAEYEIPYNFQSEYQNFANLWSPYGYGSVSSVPVQFSSDIGID